MTRRASGRAALGGAVLLALTIWTTGCSSVVQPTASSSQTPSGVSPQPSSEPGSSSVAASDKDDGHTIRLAVGQRLVITLSSTFWMFQASSDVRVLRADRSPKVVSASSSCVPGAGCGSVTATYLGVSAGRAAVTATRTSCGEAMGCTEAGSRYSLFVVVS